MPTARDPAEQAADRRYAAALLFCCLAGLAGLQLLEPRFFLCDDNASQYLSHFTHAYDAVVHHGEMPLLNQHQFLGATFLASGHTGTFLFALYPLAWLSRALAGDLRLLVDLLASLHLLLAGLGMWRLLRGRGVPRELALPLALCWAFSPFTVVVGRSWVVVTYLAAYLPWNFHFLLRFLERPTAKSGLAVAAVKSLFLFAGYFNHVALAFFCEGVFFLVRWWRLRREPGLRREIGGVAAIFLLALLVAAPLLLPAWQAMQVSAERAAPMDPVLVLANAVGPADFLAAQLPWPRDGGAPFAASTAIYFVGWPLLALLPAAWRRRRDGDATPPYLATGLVALLMSTRLYRLLYLLPVFSSLRWPFKSLPIAIFFLMLAAAAGALALSERSPRWARLARAALGSTLALQAVLLLLPATRKPYSGIRLDVSPNEVRESALFEQVAEDWRMVAARALGEGRQPQPIFNASYGFATQLGKYYVSGYDPMVSRKNLGLALGRQFEADLVVPLEQWPQVRRLLEISSARYLVVPESSQLRPVVEAGGGARRLASEGGLALFELEHAMPIVYSIQEKRALPFRWRTNGLEIDLPADFAGGEVLVNVAALDGYRWWRDGRAMDAPESLDDRILLKVEPGAAHLELLYRDASFGAGLALSLTGGLLGFLWWRREAALSAPR